MCDEACARIRGCAHNYTCGRTVYAHSMHRLTHLNSWRLAQTVTLRKAQTLPDGAEVGRSRSELLERIAQDAQKMVQRHTRQSRVAGYLRQLVRQLLDTRAQRRGEESILQERETAVVSSSRPTMPGCGQLTWYGLREVSWYTIKRASPCAFFCP